jgi:hypothetical protein
MALFQDPQALSASEAVVVRLKSLAYEMFVYNRRNYGAAWNMVWCHHTLSPQQVVAALGSDAGPLFRAAAAMSDFLSAAAPAEASLSSITLTVPTGWSYVVNSDDTVTLTQTT